MQPAPNAGHLARYLIILLASATAPLGAQDTSAVLRGFLRDSVTGNPVVAASISIEGLTTTSTTDGLGEFAIGPVPLGEYSITLGKPGYHARSFRFRITPELPDEIDIGGILMIPIITLHIDVSGSVTDVNTGEPIEGAVVTFDGRTQIQTQADGRFRFQTDDFEAGTSSLHVRMIGYEASTYPFRVTRDSASLDVQLPLLPLPVQLDEIIVEGHRVVAQGKLHGFFERRDRHQGSYLTPWEIEANPRTRVTDLLRGMPGLRISPTSFGNEVRVTRGCREAPRIFVDGMEIRNARIDDILSTQDLFAVELYVGAARIPPEFERNRGGCGVLVFWTK